MMSVDEEIVKIIRKDSSVIVADFIDEKIKEALIRIELKRLNELVPLINRGLEEVMEEEKVLIIIKDKVDVVVDDEDLIPTLTLMSEGGTLIGEEIYDPEELEELKEDPDVFFISEHFATYPNLSKRGEKQFFVVNQLRGELEGEEEIENLVSSLSIAAPSTESDHYIKDLYCMDYTDGIVTMLLGYSK